MIDDHDLGIVCDEGKCTRQAAYVTVAQGDSRLVGMYCPEHTRTLVVGVSKIAAAHGISIHDLVEVEHLIVRSNV